MPTCRCCGDYLEYHDDDTSELQAAGECIIPDDYDKSSKNDELTSDVDNNYINDDDSNDDEYHWHDEYHSSQPKVPDYMTREDAADNGYDVSDWDD